VPIFADPIEWDIHRSYESLTIVTHDGESYTSKCNVGPGVDITNTRYWAKTGAYNAQLEQYKNEVKDLSSQVTGFASDNAEFREKIDQYDKDNAEMKNTVAKNDARVDNLAERVATAETEIDGLQATTAQHTTEIADLHAKDEDLQRQITSNDNDIAALQAKDVEHDSRLNGIDTKLKSHDTSIAQNTADIAKNVKNIQDNAANIAVNARELANHAEQLKDHEARLTSQHKEITDNHTAIERLTSVTDGLRADLTEDEAKIEANRDAIAHIQEKDVQQDGRLDDLEKRATTAEERLDGLDTKTDTTNTALTAEIDRAKAAELANGKLIAKNAAELADHAEELADHETRITALEGDNTTNKQEIADIKAKNTAQDTAISGNTDAIQHINDSLAGYVKTEVYTAGQAAQDTKITAAQTAADKANTNIGDWETDHPGQSISECVTSQENELTEHAGSIAKLETDKADKTDIPDVSGFVTQTTYDAGQAVQDGRLDALENAHHYTTIADALLKQAGYLDVIDSQATFTWSPASPTVSATATLSETGISLIVQLPPDTVIDDAKTLPAGTVTVYPIFGFIHESDAYKTSQNVSSLPCTVKTAIYASSLHALTLTLTPSWNTINLIQAKHDTTPLFWNFNKALYR
jgi:chromosome segregation ATPase